jgi:hypothetical protein
MIRKIVKLFPTGPVSLFDLCVAVILLAGGLAYHWDSRGWGIGMVGDVTYGDGFHWWNGAVHVSEGFFADNPGRGFRPGYFVLTGLALPVLGTNFDVYHKFFVIALLAGCLVFYLSLRGALGRLGAACAVFMIVFNPFTAEWVATPTTDATGMLLHVLSLACLLVALNRGLSRRWLCGFGVLFMLATLTRPLVTPFLGVAVLGLVFLPAAPWRRRLWAAGCVIAAFCVPTFLWMAVQRVAVGEWSISTNDASAFYAASDPQIQVWNNSMYDRVTHLAQARYGVAAPTIAQMNHMFWRLTLPNYRKHLWYHLERIIPHLWAVADFSPSLSTHPSEKWWKLALLSVLAGGLSLWLLRRGELVRAGVVLAAGFALWLSPHTAGFLTCAGALLALLLAPGQGLAAFLLACYWLTGVAALYLTGGTWGPPLGPTVTLNALGYRVGSQVFFAGDLLAGFCLLQLAGLHLAPAAATRPGARGLFAFLSRLGQRFWAVPDAWAARGVVGSLGAVTAGTALVFLLGGGMIAGRWAVRHLTPRKAYPDLAPVVALASRGQGPGEPAPQVCTDYVAAATAVGRRPNGAVDSGDVILTGGGSMFVFNLPGQDRSQMVIYQQENASPFRMGNRYLFVETPRHFPYGQWDRKQGAFILRRLEDSQNTSHLPYYTTVPAVRAFVPLTRDKSAYDVDHAVVFPLVKNASQLDRSGELVCRQGSLTWLNDSGTEPYKRRFLLSPEKKDAKEQAQGTVRLEVDPTRARGRTRLSFAYGWKLDEVARPPAPEDRVRVRVRAVRASGGEGEELVARSESVQAGPPRSIDLDLAGHSATSVEIRFENLPRGAGVWLYEFNLQADDFCRVP